MGSFIHQTKVDTFARKNKLNVRKENGEFCEFYAFEKDEFLFSKKEEKTVANRGMLCYTKNTNLHKVV